MTDPTDPAVPPYPSFSTFDNFTKGLAKGVIPTRVDKSLLPKLSGGAQSSLLGALRYLNLIRADGAPTPELERLARASDKDRPKVLGDILRSSYAFVFNEKFDLQRGTPAEFSELFKKQKAGSGTLAKSIAFFLAAATAAGIQISPHIMNRKHTAPTGTAKRPRSTKPPKKPGQGGGGKSNTDQSADGMVERLLAKFPDFDPDWSAELKAKWFEGFDQLMNRSGVKGGPKN